MPRIVAVKRVDIPLLCLLEEQLFTCDRISARQFDYLLTRANSIVIKAMCSDMLAGYMVLLKRRKSRRLRIYSIGVTPSSRRQGVASKMFAYAEDMAAKHGCNCLSLEVSEKNGAALKFYEKSGFLCCGEKPKFYEDGSTALLFEKYIFKRDTRA